MKVYETFIHQKLKEGWSVEDFAQFFNVTHERVTWLIEHNSQVENKIRGERRTHPEEKGGVSYELGKIHPSPLRS